MRHAVCSQITSWLYPLGCVFRRVLCCDWGQMAPGARSKFDAPMFCIGESTCDVAGTFDGPTVIRRPGNCAPLVPLVTPLGWGCRVVPFLGLDRLPMAMRQTYRWNVLTCAVKLKIVYRRFYPRCVFLPLMFILRSRTDSAASIFQIEFPGSGRSSLFSHRLVNRNFTFDFKYIYI